MRKTILLIAVVCITVFFSSCKKEPVAGFTFDEEDLVANNEIKFTNTSENADEYEWDFDDGSDIDDKINPTHTFVKSGTYNISLTAIGDGGTNSYSETIEIKRPVSVYPGSALAGFEIYEEWSSVKNKLAPGYEHDVYYYTDLELYLHVIYDTENNIEIDMVGSSTDLLSDDFILIMYTLDEFDGETEEGFGIGDKFSKLESAYGNPDEYDGWSNDGYSSYDYDALGISFVKKTSGSTISQIIIYPPSEKSARLKSKNNIQTKVVIDNFKAHINK